MVAACITVADANGNTSLTWTVQDNGGGSSDTLTESLNVTVSAVNDTPVRTAGAPVAVNVAEDSANTTAVALGLGSLSYGPSGGSDEASQTLTYTVTAIPSFIKVYLADGTTEVTAGTVLANLAALQGGTMPFGAVHEYDPCVPAERQAGNFVTMVPRDANMLPPVIALDKLASACGDPAIKQGLEAELTTFINQVEGHSGQPVILRISESFEGEHAVAARIERNLWLERSYLEPEYGGRPFTLWTANPALATEVTDEPVRWVVAQP